MTVGSKTATYAYDADGIRTQKTVDGVTHTYYTLNGKLMRESFPYSDTTIIMDFIYDESGKPFAVCYSKDGGANFTTYFYATNLQGDVEGIFRVLKNGTTGLYEQKWYGLYTYDAWGNVTAYTAAGNSPGSTTLVYRNPIRYRGYVYDNETGWYYLQSRYYDPANHRFINADSYASTGQGFAGTNMFAYCNNNPVSNCDPNGTSLAVALLLLVGGFCLTALTGCESDPYPDAPADFYYYPAERRRYDGYQTMPNCYGYVWDNCNFIDPGTFATSADIFYYPRRESANQLFTEEIMIASVCADGKALGRSVRVLSSPDDIKSGEQLVACKLYDGGKDYHFAKQLSDGTWADKFGTGASRWNEIDGFADTWTILTDSGTWVFDSETIYFAFGKAKGSYR